MTNDKKSFWQILGEILWSIFVKSPHTDTKIGPVPVPVVPMPENPVDIRWLQLRLNAYGFKLTEDGDFGKVTQTKLRLFKVSKGLPDDLKLDDATMSALMKNPDRYQAPVIGSVETPWMDWLMLRIGFNEENNDNILWKYWIYTTYDGGLKAKTVRGVKYAWCKMIGNAAEEESGYQSCRSAAAAASSDPRYKMYVQVGTDLNQLEYGMGCHVRHTGGGNHHFYFAGWFDKAKKIAYGLGGNQNNQISLILINLSGNDQGNDQLMGSYWPVVKIKPAGPAVSVADTEAARARIAGKIKFPPGYVATTR